DILLFPIHFTIYMTYLSTMNLSKSYGLKILFKDLTFGISSGDKTALISQNGAGKSTLLSILAGKETPDEGEVMIRNGIRISYLEQEPQLDESMTINEFISQGNSGMVQIVQAYEKAAHDQAANFNPETQKAFEIASAEMEAVAAWDYEQRMEQILGMLNIHELDQSIATLSGGERKRVALAFVLLDNPDLLILDEPTNHLDIEMIEWLEAFLVKSNITLLMVTHDRYFLDRVCNHILELDDGIVYHHKGNYSWFLQKKAEREEVRQTEIAKAGQLMKKELEWMRRSPKARTTKSKSRIDAFYETKKKAEDTNPGQEIRLEASMARMGKKILEVNMVSKRYGDIVILNNFNHSFKRGERIGIIGENGTGKSTFLNVISGQEPFDSGNISTGETIVFGHYRQQGIEIDENMRVIDVLKEVAEVIELADGKQVSASQFLEHFMFTPDMQYTVASRLSGGEKRRLGLMMTLIKNPNFLILDEPTNDLDLITLQKLEEFLLNFGGCLILVSHDRFFMEKLVDYFLVFEGNGVIHNHHGTYAEYREKKAFENQARKREIREKSNSKAKIKSGSKKKQEEGKTKNNVRYKNELQKLENEITQLEDEKIRIEKEMNSGNLDYKELEKKSAAYSQIDDQIEKKTMQWIELSTS
ncbi:MAG: ABC-F family ATP-binding cassette domain-containing protein, partial [Balneolaceae bacterium]